MKAEKQDRIVWQENLECVRGFLNDFLTPANGICKEMKERKRFALKAGYCEKKEGSYYIGQILYDGKVIMTEKIPMVIGSKADHESNMGQVVYRLLLNMVTSGLFMAVKQSEESAVMIEKVEEESPNV